MRTGNPPTASTARFASSMLVTVTLRGIGSPIPSMVSRNSSRSSERAIARGWVPSRRQFSRSRYPFSASSEQRLRAVCPPMPERTPSILSFRMISAMVSTFSGSM